MKYFAIISCYCFQVPKVQVLPICNFHNETKLHDDKSLLVLHTLQLMHEVAMDYADQQECPQPEQQPSLLGKLKFW